MSYGYGSDGSGGHSDTQTYQAGYVGADPGQVDSFEGNAGFARLRRYRRDRTLHRVMTTNMWTGISVFISIGLAILAFAYFTVLRTDERSFWLVVIGLVLAILYTGWRWVSGEAGGAQLTGILFGK